MHVRFRIFVKEVRIAIKRYLVVSELCKKYNQIVLFLFLGITAIMLFSCGGGERLGKNPYCEFVDGNYTFDIDLRRSMFYVGKDYEHIYYNSEMEECGVDDAAYVKFKAMGNYFDESIHEEEEADLFYSSIVKLPEENSISECTINILTSLETERLIYLVKSGYSYDEAKKMVKEEIWKQLKESGLFAHYDFLNVQAFEDLNISDDCLKSLTSYFSRIIMQAARVVEDKSMCSAILYDFIESYAMSGDLDLATLNKDLFSNVDTEIFSLNAQDMLLKYSVAYYNMPFDGGIPHVNEGKIYYGIDTSTYKNKLVIPEDADLILSYPEYGRFTCNGYVDVRGMLNVDTLNTEIPLEIIVNNTKEKTIYSSEVISIDSRSPYFANTVWIMKEGEYDVVVKYEDHEISIHVVNKLTFNEKKIKQD